ncbi:MAG: hypothetical protein QGI05_04010, partial [Candidatus Omnitrophota bacterium]|nr:hypothetical protein [Candidatus Omnitrophota bacterium]
MKKKIRFILLFLIVIFLTAPVIAEEPVTLEGGTVSTDEDIVFTEDLGEGVITGKVVSVDAELSTVTVELEGVGEKVFSVAEGETILWKGIDDIALSDIEVGVDAEVGYYTDEGGALVASWVDVLIV